MHIAKLTGMYNPLNGVRNSDDITELEAIYVRSTDIDAIRDFGGFVQINLKNGSKIFIKNVKEVERLFSSGPGGGGGGGGKNREEILCSMME